jgi:hypothetical protein
VNHQFANTERRSLSLLLESNLEKASFLAISLGALAFATAEGPVARFYFDSLEYFEYSRQFTKNGSWSFFNYQDKFRGYLPIMVFGVVRGFCERTGLDALVVIRILFAFLFGALGGVLLPRLATRTWSDLHFGFGRRVALGATLIVFWSGYLSFPLTDFPALAFGVVAVLLASKVRSVALTLVSGAAAGAAMNFRPAYVVFSLAVVALTGWNGGRKNRNVRTRISASLIAFLGWSIVCAPQMLLAHHNFNLWSPVPGAAAQLDEFQLTVGLQYQLYGAYVGNNAETPRLNYVDPAGAALLKPSDMSKESGGKWIAGYGSYLGIAAREPLGVAAVMMRHIVNGLDQRYSSPYPEDLDTGQRLPFRIAGFCLVFLALLRLCWPAARRTLGPGTWGPIAVFAVAGLATIPSAMEQRFLLPIFAIASVAVLCPGWKTIGHNLLSSKDRIRIGVGVISAFAFFSFWVWKVANEATHNLQIQSIASSRGPLGHDSPAQHCGAVELMGRCATAFPEFSSKQVDNRWTSPAILPFLSW